MPSGEPSNGGRPEASGLEFPESFKGESEGWTANYASFVPDRLKPATAVIRIAIDAVETPKNDGQTSTGAEYQLASQIDFWFDLVRTWVEILTGQDLDPNHRVYDAEELGGGLTFVEPKRDGPVGFRFTTPQILPVDEEQWSMIMSAAMGAEGPPLEHILLRDARAALERGFMRRAVIDSASAVETTLARVLDKRIDEIPGTQLKRLDGKATLGRFISVAEDSGIGFQVSYEDLRMLSKVRNDAIHKLKNPEYLVASAVLRTATNFVREFSTI